MDNRKIYCYYKISPLDAIDSIEWARENFHFYDGVTSPLWNEYVQKEFARLNALYRDTDDYYNEIDYELDLIEETN